MDLTTSKNACNNDVAFTDDFQEATSRYYVGLPQEKKST